MGSFRYLPKIGTFDANKFWTNSFADGRAKLLRLVDTPEELISEMISVKYSQLPADIRYEIETSDAMQEKI
ncbi:MAG: hypothetical protein K8823_1201 [Cenarchaeum symbiont of Oopsacas minuta]|nr:hypothetical protein [Cenarchaeum symbiont of Oopsacas minuta]